MSSGTSTNQPICLAGTLWRTIRRWYAARDAAILTRLQLERAVVRHSNHLVSTSFNRWRACVALGQRKQLVGRQCVWLLETRLVGLHFVRWRAAYTARQRENTQTMTALYHWSAVLQHKVCQCLHFPTDQIFWSYVRLGWFPHSNLIKLSRVICVILESCRLG